MDREVEKLIEVRRKIRLIKNDLARVDVIVAQPTRNQGVGSVASQSVTKVTFTLKPLVSSELEAKERSEIHRKYLEQ